VNKNALLTKHSSSVTPWALLMPESILFQKTQDPLYVNKRKALSGVFFKSKLLAMCETIKSVTIAEIQKL